MEPADRTLALARHHLEIDQPQRALERLDRVGPAAVDDPDFWELRAMALLELERYGDAREAAREGLRLEGESIILLDALSLAEAHLGNLEEAERALLEALRLEPEEVTLLCHYAQLLARGGELEKAERAVAEAERLEPDDPDIVRTRMLLAYVRGDDKAAERLGRELLSMEPEDPGGHGMLGTVASQRGSFRRASRHFDIAARYDLADEDLVRVARLGRIEAHPLYWPLWPFHRFGPAKVWVAAVAVFALLAALELYPLLIAGWIVYTLLAIYSWVAPPLLRRWFERRYA